MQFEIWVLYAIGVVVLSASPGPSSFLCVTNSISHGFKAGVATGFGSLTAIIGILTLSFVGLGAIVQSSELAFNIIKWIGAAYLIYLGIQAILSKQESFSALEGSKIKTASFQKLYLSGFLVGASNPKAILFFSALFPQFIDPTGNLVEQYFVCASTFFAVEMVWLIFYSHLGNKASSWLFKSGSAKWFNRVTGGVFIAAGGAMSTLNRS